MNILWCAFKTLGRNEEEPVCEKGGRRTPQIPMIQGHVERESQAHPSPRRVGFFPIYVKYVVF